MLPSCSYTPSIPRYPSSSSSSCSSYASSSSIIAVHSPLSTQPAPASRHLSVYDLMLHHLRPWRTPLSPLHAYQLLLSSLLPPRYLFSFPHFNPRIFCVDTTYTAPKPPSAAKKVKKEAKEMENKASVQNAWPRLATAVMPLSRDAGALTIPCSSSSSPSSAAKPWVRRHRIFRPSFPQVFVF